MGRLRACSKCHSDFMITDFELNLLEEISPIYCGVKYGIPPPKLCWECRRQRRHAFWNDRNTYMRECDLTGRRVISIYSPDKPFPVYYHTDWWNTLDADQHGRDFDFNRPFFEQFRELRDVVPVPSAWIANCDENSAYNHNIHHCKNCYMCFGTSGTKDCYYLTDCAGGRDSVDMWLTKKGELCYYIYRSSGTFHCFYCERVQSSADIYFSRWCLDCFDCFGSYQLKHRKYCIFNQQYTKEQYFKFFNSLNLGSYQEVQYWWNKAQHFIKSIPINPTSGDYFEDSAGDIFYHTRGCIQVFTTYESDRCKYTYEVYNSQHSQDLDLCKEAKGLCYELVGCDIVTHTMFSYRCDQVGDSLYLFDCYDVVDCFGCVGLYQREYCILNKQYTKEEYERLVPKIIEHMQRTGEWGQFFPPQVSRFGYNESIALRHYDRSRDLALQEGFQWSDYERPRPNFKKEIHAKDLPDDIRDAPGDILDTAIICERSGRPFKIMAPELKFYKKHTVPLPRHHPDERFKKLHSVRLPPRFVTRQCDCRVTVHDHHAPGERCPNLIAACVYPHDDEQKIFCRDCFWPWIYFESRIN